MSTASYLAAQADAATRNTPPAAPTFDAAIAYFNPATGPMTGYYVGRCLHRVARSEWNAADFRVCERCDPAAYPLPVPPNL